MKGVLMAIIALLAAALVIVLSGCQSVTRVEYYEPTEANREYSAPVAGNTFGHGPVKSIEGKSGVPDFSDNKTFKFNINLLGL